MISEHKVNVEKQLCQSLKVMIFVAVVSLFLMIEKTNLYLFTSFYPAQHSLSTFTFIKSRFVLLEGSLEDVS
ncbi:MAG TPA: hypothetical protein PKW37_00850 [Salinivirgaceae bacterium]|nr:hypothetical protein [Salinivirgaceae bacterium]